MRTMRPRRITSALLIAAALLTPMRVLAQPGDATTASSLFLAGRRAMDANDYAQACPQFAESYRLDPAIGTLFNLANCEDKIGHLADASTHFRSVLEQLPTKDDRAPIARARLAAIEPRLSHLTLSLDPDQPAGAAVARDDVPISPAALGVSLAVNAGDHDVVVTAPGREPARTRITMKEGEHREASLHVGPKATSVTSHSAPVTGTYEPAQIASHSNESARRTLGFVLGGVGIVALGAGAITGIMTLGKASIVKDPSHCSAALRCDATGVDAASAGKTLSVVSTVTIIAGAAAAATGVVLVVTSQDKAPVTAAFRVSPGGVRLELGGSW